MPAPVRRPTLPASPSTSTASVLPDDVVDLLEREKAKSSSLSALIAAAEEREAEAVSISDHWRAKFDQSNQTLARLEAELAQAHDLQSQVSRLTKDLDRTKALLRDVDRQRLQAIEEFESSKMTWINDESTLKARLNNVLAELHDLQQQLPQTPSIPPESDSVLDSPPTDPDHKAAPSRPVAESTPSESTLALTAELEMFRRDKSALETQCDHLRTSLEHVKLQLTDLERVNQQLMDDNESYQILVGEKTLMGGFDLKQLLRTNDDDDASMTNTSAIVSGNTSSASSLAELEEEDEDDDPVEKAVLESHGAGSRTTGAIEAGPTRPSFKPRKSGGGLDLAAELAQAEENEAAEDQLKKAERRKKSRKQSKETERELKKLQDANKALVLYISKILDRISAHEGFEKVLSSEYSSGANTTALPKSPSTIGPSSTSLNPTNSITSSLMSGGFLSSITKSSGGANSELKPLNLPVTNPAPPQAASGNTTQRSSWLKALFGNKTPATTLTPSAGIKPLKLGAGSSSGSPSSAGLVSGWTGIKDPELVEAEEEEEDSEEAKARERRLAEMKLHGMSDSLNHDSDRSTVDRTIRANRRSSSMYGPSSSGFDVMSMSRKDGISNSGGGTSTIAERRRTSGDLIGQGLAPPANLSPAGIMKRVEEREKESRSNLSKGQASGFTEIEIRGSRLRPANHLKRSSTGHTSSGSNVNSTANTPQGSPLGVQSGTGPSAQAKDSKASSSAESNTAQNNNDNEGILARTARRISLMRS